MNKKEQTALCRTPQRIILVVSRHDAAQLGFSPSAGGAHRPLLYGDAPAFQPGTAAMMCASTTNARSRTAKYRRSSSACSTGASATRASRFSIFSAPRFALPLPTCARRKTTNRRLWTGLFDAPCKNRTQSQARQRRTSPRRWAPCLVCAGRSAPKGNRLQRVSKEKTNAVVGLVPGGGPSCLTGIECTLGPSGTR